MHTALDKAFSRAIHTYPHPVYQTSFTVTSEFTLVDAPDRRGMLVLHERRGKSKHPFHHWGYMIEKSKVEVHPKPETVDHTDQPPDLDSLLVTSTHLTEEDTLTHEAVHLTLGMEEIDGEKFPATNCWGLSINAEGGLSLWSHSPLDEHYPSYPRILFDTGQVRELLAFLEKHRGVINQ